MERPSVDGGCGAVYPHGALHAPVRAPDGELEDGPEGKRCSSSTMVFPLAPYRVTFVSMRYPHILTGWGRQGEPCTTIPSISSIGCVRETSFFFFASIHFAKKEGIFFKTWSKYIYASFYHFFSNWPWGNMLLFVVSKKRLPGCMTSQILDWRLMGYISENRRNYLPGGCIPSIGLLIAIEY